FAPEHVPGEAHVLLGRTEVADREAEDIAAVDLRVREEDFAGRVDTLEETLVLLVRSLEAEADEREVPRRDDFPAWLGSHPFLEERGEPHVLADLRLQPRAPVAAEDGPELQGAKTSSERDRDLAQIDRLVRRAQEFGNEAEGAAEVVRTTRPEDRAVHRRP